MKTFQHIFASIALAGAVGLTHAAPPIYHVTEGYYGSVTFKASGSCGFKPVTYKNAWLGSVLDSTDTPVGWGIITASGDLLVLETDFAPVKYVENSETGVGKDVSYTNMVGPLLSALVMGQSGCSIWSIEPNTNSRTTIKWDIYKGKDRVQMNANFSGFEEKTCQPTRAGQECSAGKFTGSVIFKGDWSRKS